jgi:hypothetical protein
MHYVPRRRYLFVIEKLIAAYHYDAFLFNDATNCQVCSDLCDKNNILVKFHGIILSIIPAFLFAEAHTRYDLEHGIRASDITELRRATQPLTQCSNRD